jgi:hypothetical protein
MIDIALWKKEQAELDVLCSTLSKNLSLSKLEDLEKTNKGIIVKFWRTNYPNKISFVEWLDWMEKKDDSRKDNERNGKNSHETEFHGVTSTVGDGRNSNLVTQITSESINEEVKQTFQVEQVLPNHNPGEIRHQGLSVLNENTNVQGQNDISIEETKPIKMAIEDQLAEILRKYAK